MSVTVRWFGDKAHARLRDAAAGAIRAAAALVQTRARILCNAPAKRMRRRRRRTTPRGPRGSWYTEFVGSAPGQPPMLRTSFGRRNILTEFYADSITAKVGPSVNADYMAYLELGTAKIAPRPWLSRALREVRPAIDALLRGALGKAAGGR